MDFYIRSDLDFLGIFYETDYGAMVFFLPTGLHVMI